jgi:p-cumate 2,3-dioxygenase beta subunit
MNHNPNAATAAPVSREAIENFLFYEASLLDDWLLDDWLSLFTEDGIYIVPSPDKPDGDPWQSHTIVSDDMMRQRQRVARLMGRHAYREFPYARTRHYVTNVRVAAAEGDVVRVLANFLVYRVRDQSTRQGVDPFMGKYEYVLVRQGDGFKIRSRKAILDLEALRPHGSASIII